MKATTFGLLAIFLTRSLLAEVKLKDFRRNKETAEMKLYINGLGSGMNWANLISEKDYGRLLYCPPPKLGLGTEIFVSIIEDYAKEHNAPPDSPVELLLIEGLRETFPCKQGERK